MQQEFKSGDIVRLVSGGPDMTVGGIHYDVLANEYVPDMYDCVWFEKGSDPKQDVHYGVFSKEELVIIKEKKHDK